MADQRKRNITLFNNNTFRLTLDMSAWAAVYDLKTCSFRLTIRPNLPTGGINKTITTLSFSSVSGARTVGKAVYFAQAKQLQFTAPEAALEGIAPTSYGVSPVSYSYDAEIEDSQGNVVTFLYGGATVNEGVS